MQLIRVGQQLKKVRTASSKNLADISNLTNIPIDYLIAIENGNVEKLPSYKYVQAFLFRYAQTLHLNAQAVVDAIDESEFDRKRLSKQKVVTNNLDKMSALFSKLVANIKKINRSFLLIATGLVIFVLAVFLLMTLFFSNNVAKNSTSSKNVSSTIKILGTPAINGSNKTYTVSDKNTHSINIVANKSVFVVVKQDGTTVFADTITAGNAKQFTFVSDKKELAINLGDPTAAAVIFDNVDVSSTDKNLTDILFEHI